MFFISSCCKAQFYNNSQMTFLVKKDCVQVIFKLQRGLYLTISLFALANNRVLLACSWDNFWTRVKCMRNHREVLAKLEKKCPLSARIFTTTYGPHFAYIDKEMTIGAVVLEFESQIPLNGFLDFMQKDILDEVNRLMLYNLDLLVELEESCPFLQWKNDLVSLKTKR